MTLTIKITGALKPKHIRRIKSVIDSTAPWAKIKARKGKK